MRRTLADIKRELAKLHPKIRIIGSYVNSGHPMKCKCLTCSHIWSPRWDSLKQREGCPKCYGNVKLTTPEVRRKLASINPSIKILSEYTWSKGPLTCLCKRCKTKWTATWNLLSSQKSGCPNCYAYKSEGIVRKIFERLTGKSFVRCAPEFLRSRKTGRKPQLDGYNKKLGIAFEHQGSQHYGPMYWDGYSKERFEAQRRRDMRKRKQCQRHGVALICVPHSVGDMERFVRSRLEMLERRQNVNG